MNTYSVYVHSWTTTRNEVVIRVVIKARSAQDAALYCEKVVSARRVKILSVDILSKSSWVSNVAGRLLTGTKCVDISVVCYREHDNSEYFKSHKRSLG